MCVLECDPCELFTESHRTARKHHLCDSCNRVIKPGQKYLTTFVVFEGTATSSKGCPGCEEIIDRFGKAHKGYRFAPMDIIHWLEQCLAEDEEYDEPEDVQWRQDYDWIRLGLALFKKSHLNRTV